MNFVIDTSVAIAACIGDEKHHHAARLLLSRTHVSPGMVPALFWSEVRNALLKSERAGRILAGSSHLHVRYLRRLRLVVDTSQVDKDVLSVASQHGLTGYDAEYLETAMRRKVQLVTFDKKLLSAAKREGVAFDLEEHSTVD